MTTTVITTCPSADNDFEPLSEYQAQTPQTFFGGKPILYYHDTKVKTWASKQKIKEFHFFSNPDGDGPQPSPPYSYALSGSEKEDSREEDNVEVFVASKYVSEFS